MPQSPARLTSDDPDSPDARACLRAYFALLADRIPGIDPTHVPDPDPEAASFRAPHGTFLVARAGATILGCVSLKTVEPGLGEVKRLWVAPESRGQGLGRRLMIEVEDFARSIGLTQLRLDTNSALTEALALYAKTGWEPTAPFTRAFPATDWFAKRL
ncbi:GNAT family N-acetyltransferase [Tabrizicola sp.]|uniref:GNAT family N-acetyltransferase n=1 Tax=Tabrizicola sp. TaxID=2005166 RepID=UPI0035B1DD41